MSFIWIARHKKKQNINYNMEHSNITTWSLCFFFFLSCFISFRAPNASLKKKRNEKKKTLSIHSMTRFYLRTHCWMTAMTSIHISYPPHSRLTPCLQLRLLTWHLFGKKMDRMWFGQYEWLIVCYKNNSTHTHMDFQLHTSNSALAPVLSITWWWGPDHDTLN